MSLGNGFEWKCPTFGCRGILFLDDPRTTTRSPGANRGPATRDRTEVEPCGGTATGSVGSPTQTSRRGQWAEFISSGSWEELKDLDRGSRTREEPRGSPCFDDADLATPRAATDGQSFPWRPELVPSIAPSVTRERCCAPSRHQPPAVVAAGSRRHHRPTEGLIPGMNSNEGSAVASIPTSDSVDTLGATNSVGRPRPRS